MDDNALNMLIKYFDTLSGTISFNTDRYTGYKIRGKIYAQVAEKLDYISVLVRRKFVSDIEINTLQISLSNYGVWKQYAELRIPKLEDIEPYLNIIHNAFYGTMEEYDASIQEIIESSIETENQIISEISNSDDFYHERLIDYFTIYNTFDISTEELIELKSDFKYKKSFNYENVILYYINEDSKYKFMNTILNLLIYIYKNILDVNFQSNEDLLKLNIIKEQRIIESLINYKLYGDMSLVSDYTNNLISYVNNPYEALPIFNTSLLCRFIKNIYPDSLLTNNYYSLCKTIYDYLSYIDFDIKKEENRGVIYSKLLVSNSIVNKFYFYNNYFKLQPYLEESLSVEEIEYNLEKEVIISRDKTLLLKSCINNIFYAVKGESPMFLGVFTEEGIEISKGVYSRKFKKISYNNRGSNFIPQDKLWGSLECNNSIIKVKWDENKQFEQAIIMNLFGYDSETLVNKINEVSQSCIDTIDDVIDSLDEYRTVPKTPLNIILQGPIATGKTFYSISYATSIIEEMEVDSFIESINDDRSVLYEKFNKYKADKRIVTVACHKNYSYESFLLSNKETNGNITLGIFRDIVERAAVNINKNYAIVLEDIDTLDIRSVFGEALNLMDVEKRYDNICESYVTLPNKEIISIPNNLYIICTLSNNFDNTNFDDIFLKRIFNYISLFPRYDKISFFKENLKALNDAIYSKKGETKYLIGHSIFVNKSLKDIKSIVNNQLIPILSNYFFNDHNIIKEVLSCAGINVKNNIENYYLEFESCNIENNV